MSTTEVTSAEAGDPMPSTSSHKVSTTEEKRAERRKKLEQLHYKREEGSRLNHREVVEEHKRSQLPKIWMKKKEFAEKKLTEQEEREKAEQDGVDFDRRKFLDIQADEAERWDRRQDKKKNLDTGFSSYEDATARQYTRLTRNIKPDMDHYQSLKESVGDEVFYPSSDTIVVGATPKDDPEKVDKMAAELEKQIEKRSKYSRRRMYDEDADVDFINERNSKFNKKLERFYGKYTQDIKQNLERGTAI